MYVYVYVYAYAYVYAYVYVYVYVWTDVCMCIYTYWKQTGKTAAPPRALVEKARAAQAERERELSVCKI